MVAAMETDGDQYEAPLDLEAYAAQYRGHAKIDRLLFVASKSAGTPLELEALRLAVDELKKSEDTGRYTSTCEQIGGRLGPQYTLDSDWVEATERRASAQQQKLETELSNYKTNLVKESIRSGHNDLGDFFYQRGDLQNAFKCYVRTRDYCTASKHIVGMCLNVVRVSIELGNYVHVNNYVQKAEGSPGVGDDAVVASKLKAAAGLAALHGGKLKAAARKFAEVNSELGSQYADVLAASDVATIGGLCALASFDRSELKARVIDNIHFREFLELVPEVREVVNDFYGARYATCLQHLQRLRLQLALDMHLAGHVDTLYKAIRSKALVQYSAPFTSVSLATMANAFNTDIGGLERELESLIMAGDIEARIDSHNKVLYARHRDARGASYSKAIQMAETYIRDTRALLLRANLLRHDFVARAPAGGEGGRPPPPVAAQRERGLGADREMRERGRAGMVAQLMGERSL